MSFFEPFLLQAIIGGVGIAIICGPLGSYVVWHRMAYFGDALSHSALLGIGFSLLLNLYPLAGILTICILIGILLTSYNKHQLPLSNDSILGIISHSSLALGIILIYIQKPSNFDIFDYLFGNILTITSYDIILIYGCVILNLSIIYRYWSQLIATTIDPNLAKIHNINASKIQLIFTIMMALTIGISIKLIGTLLITSILIIPAATARHLAHTPKQMAILSSLIGILGVILGTLISAFLDVPTGPMIILSFTTLFLCTFLKKTRA